MTGSEALASTPRAGGPTKAQALFVVQTVLVLSFLPTITTAVIPAWLGVRGFYSHGLLVLALMASLLWSRRRALLQSSEAGSLGCALGGAALSCVWFAAWAADLLAVQLAAMVGVMLLAGSAVLGKRSLTTFGAPFALLWLAVPMWSPIQPSLQLSAAAVVQAMVVGLAGVPVYIEANLVHVPAGVFEIERGCSGLGFLLVSLSLTGYLILSSRPTLLRAAVLTVGAVLLALAANWLRIFIIILVAELLGMHNEMVLDHVWLGWGVYAVLLLPAVWLAPRWLEGGRHEQAEAPADTPSGTGPGKVSAAFLVLVCVVCASLPVASMALDYLQQSRPLDPLRLPGQAGAFRNQGAPPDAWAPAFPEADRTRLTEYRDAAGDRVMAFSASYASQREGREVVSIVNDLGGRGWLPKGREPLAVVAAGNDVTLTESRFENDVGGSLCVWSWYRIGGVHAATELDAKIAQMKQKLLGRSDASVVAVAATTDTRSCEPVRKRLRAVAEALPRGFYPI